jgi:hypothetical protein
VETQEDKESLLDIDILEWLTICCGICKSHGVFKMSLDEVLDSGGVTDGNGNCACGFVGQKDLEFDDNNEGRCC